MALLLVFYLIFSTVIFSAIIPASAADNSQTTAATVIKASGLLLSRHGSRLLRTALIATPRLLRSGDGVNPWMTDRRRPTCPALIAPTDPKTHAGRRAV